MSNPRIIIPGAPYDRQPVVADGIDFDHPKRPILAYNAATHMVHSREGVRNSTNPPPRTVLRTGIGTRGQTASQTFGQAKCLPLPLTVFAIARPFGWGGAYYIMVRHLVGANNGWTFGSAASNQLNFTLQGVAGYDTTTYPFDSDIAPRVVAMVASGNGGTVRFFRDGVFLESKAIGSLLGGNTAGVITINGLTADANSYLAGAVAFQSVFSDAEVAEYSNNIWSVYKRPARSIFAPQTGVAPTFKPYFVNQSGVVIGAGVL